jgi:anti-anti-sigma factor
MKRQLTASRSKVGDRKGASGESEGTGSSGVAAAERQRTPFSLTTPVRPASIERDVALASVSAWTHTIVLTGELTHRSAHKLEVEIERLCAEGVTEITLDLRELSYIDPIGIAVIAFRGGLCKRRGYDFALIPGSPLMRRAFEQAGVERLLDARFDADADADVTASAPSWIRPLALAGTRSKDREV